MCDLQTKRALLEHWEAQLDGSLSAPDLDEPGGGAEKHEGHEKEDGKGQADMYRTLVDKLEVRAPRRSKFVGDNYFCFFGSGWSQERALLVSL